MLQVPIVDFREGGQALIASQPALGCSQFYTLKDVHLLWKTAVGWAVHIKVRFAEASEKYGCKRWVESGVREGALRDCLTSR